MKNTTNYGLKKPDGTDAVDIAIINQNMDTIDTTMKSNANQINDLKNNKANTSHGNHIPATQTANNKKFLRCDNTWQDVTPGNIGAAPASHTHDDRYYTETEINTKLNAKANTSHTHTKSQITDFPTSLPANGGNADTVDGLHSYQIETLDTNGGRHGHTGFTATIQHNVHGDGRFKLQVDDFQTRVDYATECDRVKGRDLVAEFDSLKSAVSNPKVVKSVQRGFIAADKADYIDSYYSKDYAISAVNPSKTMINLYSHNNSKPVCGRLMNATTLRVFYISTGEGNYYVRDVSWEVIEFY